MYQWKKDIVKWKVGNVLYLSVIFSWQLQEAEMMAKAHKGKVVIGGCALGKPTECKDFDVLTFHNPCATFTTRGCPNRCSYCIVPKVEGDFQELENWKPAPVICDNNICASSPKHFDKVIESLKGFAKVDFNQGLDALLFNSYQASKMQELKNVVIRFAFDHVNKETIVADAIALARSKGFKDIRCYVLINHNDTPEDALYRLEFLRKLKVLTSPMRYQPLSTKKKNDYLAPAWTEQELRRVMRYYSKLNWLGHIPFEEYNPIEEDMFTGVF